MPWSWYRYVIGHSHNFKDGVEYLIINKISLSVIFEFVMEVGRYDLRILVADVYCMINWLRLIWIIDVKISGNFLDKERYPNP